MSQLYIIKKNIPNKTHSNKQSNMKITRKMIKSAWASMGLFLPHLDKTLGN